MKTNTYQLSQSGIERLQRFKADILAGDFKVNIGVKRDDGKIMYYTASNEDSTTCVFTGDKSKVLVMAIKNIENTLKCGIEMRHHLSGSRFYCSKNATATGLNRSDITTPAQRALEALGDKFNNRSICNA